MDCKGKACLHMGMMDIRELILEYDYIFCNDLWLVHTVIMLADKTRNNLEEELTRFLQNQQQAQVVADIV
jgi:hypothetical protein